MEEGGKDTDETLFRMLREISPFYFFRKIQQVDLAALNRFVRILGDSQDHRGTGDLTVLNYGCGAADVALLAAAQGCRATICDVEGDNLEYASTRFANRGLAVETIGATSKTPIPRFRDKYDVIVAKEVLEHVREPFLFLEVMKESLLDTGVLMLGSFPFRPTSAEGDHLEEAVSRRTELAEWISENLSQYERDSSGRSFVKKGR